MIRVLLLLLHVLLPDPSPRGESEDRVLLVLSSAAEPYQVVAGVLEERHRNLALERVLLADLKIDSLSPDAVGTPRAVMAIGSLEAGRLARQLDEEIPLLYCMVSDRDELGLTDRPSCWGVTTAVPPALRCPLPPP